MAEERRLIPSSSPLRIGERPIGPGRPTYIVAEMSGNHNHDFQRALAILRAAKEAGADAVKLQTYTADTMTIASDDDRFRIHAGSQWDGRTLYDLYREAYTPWEWHAPLMAAARDMGIELFSSPFDSSAVDFLEQLGVRTFKVASFEIVDIPLIQRIARIGKPMIISTGMASISEIEEAVSAARGEGNDQIVLLKCTSAYPADLSEMNLATIPHLSATFGLPTGLSDHSLGITAPIAGVVMGACLVEKHFTLGRSDGGPDAAFSLEPGELAAMVRAIREAERSIGSVHYGPTAHERDMALYRRSLFAVEGVRAGEKFTEQNVRSIRPAHGLAPKHLKDVLGRRASRDIARGTPLSWELITGD